MHFAVAFFKNAAAFSKNAAAFCLKRRRVLVDA